MDKSYYFNEAFKIKYGYDSSTGLDEIDIKIIDQESLYKKIYRYFGFIGRGFR